MEERLKLMREKQLNNICNNKKLKDKDMKRIIKYTDNCIFGEECSLWKGYITNNKSTYINFFFNGKKNALHRILYLNFIGNLYENSYLSYSCSNSGKCCNINHIKIKKNCNIINNIKKNNNNSVSFD